MTEQAFSPVEWLTTREAAELTGYKQVSIRQAIHRDKVHAVKRGNTWFVRREDILDYLKRMSDLGTKKFTPQQYRETEE